MTKLQVYSLFTGVGGFDLGLERAGMEIVGQAESDQFAASVLRRHWPNVELMSDVRDVTTVNADMIVGGFPCQDISVAGKRKGLDGARSGLWWEFYRIIETNRPQWVVIENVANLLSTNRGRDMGAIVGTLSDIGYWVEWRVLDSRYFGVPQRRRRVFIVGHLGNRSGREILFERESSTRDSSTGVDTRPTERHPRRSVASVDGNGSTDPVALHLTQTPITGPISPTLSAEGRIGVMDRRLREMATVNNETVDTLMAKDHKGYSTRIDAGDNKLITVPPEGVANTLQARDHKGVPGYKDFHAGRANLIPMRPIHENQRGEITVNRTAGSLTIGGGKPGQGYPAALDGWRVRKLTPLECERLQGFPDNWTAIGVNEKGREVKVSDTQRIKQMGNAVTVNVIEWIGGRIVLTDND